MKNYYKILEVSTQASQAEIKKSYRRLAVQYHPDKNSYPHADTLFSEINEAYTILSNPIKRQQYNNSMLNFTKRHRHNYQSQYRPQSPPRTAANPRQARYSQQKNMETLNSYRKYMHALSLLCSFVVILIFIDPLLPPQIYADVVIANTANPTIEQHSDYNMETLENKNEIKDLITLRGHYFMKESDLFFLPVGLGINVVESRIFSTFIRTEYFVEDILVKRKAAHSIYNTFIAFPLLILLITGISMYNYKNTEFAISTAIATGALLMITLMVM